MACTDCTVHSKQCTAFPSLRGFAFRFAAHSFPYHKRDKMRKESVKLAQQQKAIQNYLLRYGL